MQATVQQPNLIIDILRSPAVVIGACAVFVRWVIAPAVTNYMRHELQAELKQLAQFPLFVERVERMESAIETLPKLLESVARIEEQLTAFAREMERRQPRP